MTVRAKSEKRKKIIEHKEVLYFREREAIMAQRRNEFFARSIRNIGKTKLQIKREENEKILKKRLIQLGGGFELHRPKSPTLNKKLLRSGTTISPKKNSNTMTNKSDEESQKSKRPSFINNELIEELKHIKDEVK